MVKSSIHFRPARIDCERHNTRQNKPDYLLPERAGKHWSKEYDQRPIRDIRDELEKNYVKHHPQRKRFDMRTEPIREAVINLEPKAFLNEEGKISLQAMFEALHRLNIELYKKYRLKALKCHIHGDEGHKDIDGKIKVNWHAHVVYAWQDLSTGKSLKLSKQDMSDIQTLTAEVLGMERGKLWSKAERLEHQVYRNEMQKLEKTLQQFKEKNPNLNILTKKTIDEHIDKLKEEVKEQKSRGFRL